MRFHCQSLLLLLVSTSLPSCQAFVAHSKGNSHSNRRAPFVVTPSLRVYFDDFGEEFSNNNEDPKQKESGSTSDLYAALRARQADFKTSSSSFVHIDDYLGYENKEEDEEEDDTELIVMDEESYCLENWRDASCTSTVRLTLDDWIRRIAVDTYPLAVCGTASGHLYLADLQEGEELDCIMNVHVNRGGDFLEQETDLPAHLPECLLDLYGQFDGGGVISLAMKDDWIVSTGREGGAHLCRIVGHVEEVYKGSRGGKSKQTKLSLQRLGKFRGLLNRDGTSNVVITSAVFDSIGTLWLGGYDGVLRGYDYEDRDAEDQPTMVRERHPMTQIDLGSPIVNLSVNDELGCGVASTVTDGLVIFSLEDEEILARWNPLIKKVRKEFVRSAILVKDDSNPNEDEPPVWSVFCGGSRGSLFQRKLNVDRTGSISETRPFLDQTSTDESVFPVKLRPNHMGPIVALASPAPGLLVSGAQDGSMRVWDYAVFGNAEDDDDEEDEEDDDAEDDDDEEEEAEELEAQYDDVQPNDSRPQCLYALSGYKVWLGSIFASSRKLVSDGADNTIIVHSFEDEEEVLYSEDDDEDDVEGFSFE